MTKSNPIATVIIVNWNNNNLLQKCLLSLERQTEKRFEVIVVDNGSSDGSVDSIKCKFKNVRLIALNENKGFSEANNIAFGYVKTKYTATLNNDTVVHHNWLANLIHALEMNPNAGLAASKILFYKDPRIIDRIGDAYSIAGAGILKGRGEASKKSKEDSTLVFGACAAAALYRTDMIRRIGFFDNDFFLIYEDVDLSFRAQLFGYKCIYVPIAIIYHHCSNTIGNDSYTSIYYGHRNNEWAYIKNMPTLLIYVTLSFHIIYDILAFIYFFIKGHSRIFIKAKIDAIKGIKSIYRKRKKIQKMKTVGSYYIWSMLDKEVLLHRLYGRLNLKNINK